MEETKVSLEELQSILKTMNQYKRECGFISVEPQGKLKFYDAEPSFGGAFVTKSDIINYINQYN